MSEYWYYDFMNPGQFFSRVMLGKDKQLLNLNFGDIKDIISTKVSMFKYDKIEEKIPGLTSEILERALLLKPNLCFYKSTGFGLVLCQFITASNLDLYLKPEFVNLVDFKGNPIAYDVPYKDIIPIRDNALDLPPILSIYEYLNKLQYVDTSVFKVLNISALPLLLVGNKKVAKSLNEIAKGIGSNKPFIVGDDTLPDAVKSFNINVPVSPLDIYKLKRNYKYECLNSIGIYTSTETAERKTISEVTAQNDHAENIYRDMLDQRIYAFKRLKEEYGIDIPVVESYMETVKANAEEARKMAIANNAATPVPKNIRKGDEVV